ncbi:MAG: nucleoside deaminase [Myxococcota bacterium]
MAVALVEAERAAERGDVPVGAVLLDATGAIISRGHNRREQALDPIAHAEVEALRNAPSRGSWRFDGCTMVVTLEPCIMCAGALLNARIERVVYGCTDPKGGALDSLFAVGRDPRLNHRFDVVRGVREEECAGLLKRFFAARRR